MPACLLIFASSKAALIISLPPATAARSTHRAGVTRIRMGQRSRGADPGPAPGSRTTGTAAPSPSCAAAARVAPSPREAPSRDGQAEGWPPVLGAGGILPPFPSSNAVKAAQPFPRERGFSPPGLTDPDALAVGPGFTWHDCRTPALRRRADDFLDQLFSRLIPLSSLPPSRTLWHYSIPC